MKKTFFFFLRITAVQISILMLPSCKDEFSCETCLQKNNPPVANAGLDKVITLPTDSTVLDGRASKDADGRISKWLWTKIAGSDAVMIVNKTAAQTLVTKFTAGVYQFELMVTDNGGLVEKDTVQVKVDDATVNLPTTNQPPVACAGPDQTIALPTNSINLDGSCSTDPDGNITAYMWTKIDGPEAPFKIVSAGAVQTEVTGLVKGVYHFELQVMDAGGRAAKDTMQVRVK